MTSPSDGVGKGMIAKNTWFYKNFFKKVIRHKT